MLIFTQLVLLGGCGRPPEEAPRGKVSAEVADKGPRLVGKPPTVQIELPPRMTGSVAQAGKNFATLTPFDFVQDVVPGDTTAGAWAYPYDGRQSPFAVIGDFDGDGRDDVALLQRNTDPPAFDVPVARILFVFDRADGKETVQGYPLFEFDSPAGAKTGFYLTRFRAGPYRQPDFGGSGDSMRTIDFPHEGVQLSNYGKTARAIGWNGKGFVTAQTGD